MSKGESRKRGPDNETSKGQSRKRRADNEVRWPDNERRGPDNEKCGPDKEACHATAKISTPLQDQGNLFQNASRPGGFVIPTFYSL